MNKDVSLLDILIVLAKNKLRLFLHFLFCTVIAVLIAILLPKTYKSELTFIPQGDSRSGLMALVGEGVGGDLLSGMSFKKQHYVEILKSREVKEQLIDEFDLISVYEFQDRPNGLDLTLKALEKKVQISEVAEGGLGVTDILSVKITALDKSPQRASNMCNRLYELLIDKVEKFNKNKYNKIVTFVEEYREKMYLQLQEEREILKTFQNVNKVYDIDAQVSAVINELARLKSELLATELELKLARRSNSSQSSTILILKEKQKNLIGKIREVEKGAHNNTIFLGLSKSVDLSFSYLDKKSSVMTMQKYITLLDQQILQAKTKYEKSAAEIYLLDKARPAQWKYKPKRALVVLGIIFVYMLIIVIDLLLLHFVKIEMQKETSFTNKVRELKSALLRRKK